MGCEEEWSGWFVRWEVKLALRNQLRGVLFACLSSVDDVLYRAMAEVGKQMGKSKVATKAHSQSLLRLHEILLMENSVAMMASRRKESQQRRGRHCVVMRGIL